MRGTVIVTLAAQLAAAASSPNPLSLFLSPTGYTLSAPSGWLLTSTPLRARFSGHWLNASDGSLLPSSSPTSAPGVDAWGPFNATTLFWASAAAPTTTLLETTFLVYAASPAIGFRATYPRASLTRGPGAPTPSVEDSDGLAAEFPAWAMDGGGAGLGFLQWSGTMLNQKGDAGPFSGGWVAGANVSLGKESGPVALFDKGGANSLVLSSSAQFMAVSAALTLEGGGLAWGPMGSIDEVPEGFSYECVAWYGPGINSNVMAWGGALLDKFGKAKGQSKSDFTNTHLGLSTDNGAYYYYSPGNYSNYSMALPAVYAYAQQEGIPYRHILLDSWW